MDYNEPLILELKSNYYNFELLEIYFNFKLFRMSNLFNNWRNNEN